MNAPPTRSLKATNPAPLPPDFRNRLRELGPSDLLGPWETQVGPPHEMAWFAGTLKLGLNEAMLSVDGHPLSFRSGLTVHLLQPCWSDANTGGVQFETCLFRLADQLEVVIWLERNGSHALMAYRGDGELFKVVGFELQVNGDQ